MEANCNPNFSLALCRTGNACGYISNVIWIMVLFPQIYKNYVRKSVTGLSLTWACANFTASLVNLLFLITITVPLWVSILAIYMPVLEFVILVQFLLYEKNANRHRVIIVLAVGLIIWTSLILIAALLPDAPSNMVMISLILWSIQTLPQIWINLQLNSTSGQSSFSTLLAFIGKNTDFIAQIFLVIAESRYLYMHFFSSTLAFINGMQVLFYSADIGIRAKVFGIAWLYHGNSLFYHRFESHSSLTPFSS